MEGVVLDVVCAHSVVLGLKAFVRACSRLHGFSHVLALQLAWHPREKPAFLLGTNTGAPLLHVISAPFHFFRIAAAACVPNLHERSSLELPLFGPVFLERLLPDVGLKLQELLGHFFPSLRLWPQPGSTPFWVHRSCKSWPT